MMTCQQEAIGLYAVLDRDPTDFVDMVSDAHPDTITTLYAMLTLTNQGHSDHTIRTNALGASIVAGIANRRGICLIDGDSIRDRGDK